MHDEIEALDQALATADLSSEQEAALRGLGARLAAHTLLTVPSVPSSPVLVLGPRRRSAARPAGEAGSTH